MFLMAENGRWKGEAENGEYQMKGSAVLQQRVGELKLWSKLFVLNTNPILWVLNMLF